MMVMLNTKISKCVRFTHKQLDKRSDMKLTDDTVAKRAKLFDSPSSSSSSHKIVPNLHDSCGERALCACHESSRRERGGAGRRRRVCVCGEG